MCPHCESGPEEPASLAENSIKKSTTSSIFCGRCGAPLRPGLIFCGKCGAKNSKPLRKIQPPHEVKETTVAAKTETPEVEETHVAAKTETPEVEKTTVAAKAETPEVEETHVAAKDDVDFDPVVGWVVCVAGECKGQSFNLKSGHNYIWSAISSGAHLTSDKGATHEKRAIITYEPRAQVFIIEPGEGSELAYFNEELLLAPQLLKAYDKVKVGNSEFVFVPCCGEQFSWKDYQ